MKKIRKVTISAIAILFVVYNSCLAAKMQPEGRTEPTVVGESAKSNYCFYFYIAIGITALLGIIFISAGLGIKNNKKRKIANCSSTTKGKVIDIVKRFYGDGIHDSTGYAYHPKIEYNVNEQKYVKISNFGTNPSKYEIGQEVEIHYNPDKCDMYYIDGDNTQKKLGTIFTVVGSIVLIMAVLVGIIGTIMINNDAAY